MKNRLPLLIAALAIFTQGCGDARRPACAPVAPCQPVCAPTPAYAAALPAAPSNPVGEADLLHHRFVLVSMNGAPLPPTEMEKPYIEFNEGMRVSGRACNQFRGPGKLENGVLTVPNMATTRMFCLVPELNALDTLLAAMLEKGATLSLSGDELTLSNGGDVLVYSLSDWVR